MALKLSEEVGHFCKDNEILKIKFETISASERSCVTYVQDSLTWPDTSSVAPENNGVKTYKESANFC
jgi:hypothetical protein